MVSQFLERAIKSKTNQQQIHWGEIERPHEGQRVQDKTTTITWRGRERESLGERRGTREGEGENERARRRGSRKEIEKETA